jgi:glycosyltransferase involved in cell wall biosynthesis
MRGLIKLHVAEHAPDAVLLEQLSLAQYSGAVGGPPVLLYPVDAISRFKEQLRRRDASRPLLWLARCWDEWMTRRYEKAMYAKATRVVLASEADRRYLRDELGLVNARLCVIPNAVDVKYFTRTKPRAGGTQVLLFSSFRNEINRDGLDYFVGRIVPRVLARGVALRLVIVGNGARDAMHRYHSLPVPTLVEDYVEDPRPYFEECAVSAVPLRMGTGVKNRVLQAMAMETPIVTSPLGVDALPVRHGEECLIGATADEFAEHLAAVLRSPECADALVMKARRYVEHAHSIEAVTARWLALFSDVVAEAGIRA